MSWIVTKYLRTLGFDAANDIFAEHAWFFRNALVRANYNDLKNGIHETTEYLELFLKNLLLDEKNELHNRMMHISGNFETKVDIESAKVDIESAKVDIGSTKVDIECAKVDIRTRLVSFSKSVSEKTINYAIEMYLRCGTDAYFGRTRVEEITGLKSSAASKLIRVLLDSDVIMSVTGHGKGKYRFR